MVSKKRKIIWSDESRFDRSQIYDYWDNRNKSADYSRKLRRLFKDKMLQVSENPFIGKKSNLVNVRTVVVRDNLLVYKIFDDKILVLSVWEGHQDPEKFDF